MTYNLEIYNPTKVYITPDNKIATPDQIQMNYSAVNNFKCVIYSDASGEMLYAIEPFNAMKQRLGITETFNSDEDALLAMETIINAPPVVNTEPTAEERIASALEYQNLML